MVGPLTQVLETLNNYPGTHVLGRLAQVLGPLNRYPMNASETLVNFSTTVAQVPGNFFHYPSTTSGTRVKSFPVS